MGKDGEPEVTETRTDGRDDTSRGFLFTFHSASLIVPQPPLRYGPILPVSSVHPSPVGSLREVNGTRWEDGA